MANRMFQQPAGSLEVGCVTLYGTITIGSTGAVSASTGKGITSVTRNSAGKYTVLLNDTYNSLLFADAKILHSTLSDASTVGIYANIFSQAVATAAAPTVIFQFVALDDGAAADPASGAVIYYKIEVKNSSVA